MFFCYREATGFRKIKDRGYRIGYAYSEDMQKIGLGMMIQPTRCINPSLNDWDSDMMCYPHIFHFDNNVYLLYNGNEFGRYGFGLAILEN